MGAAPDEALDGAGFARLIDPLGPFEPAPVVAAAVSGGPDSLALALLAAPWAAGRGGSLVALVVDHGLSDGSAAAAERALQWLAGRGIAGVGLRWRGPRPKSGIQAAARAARYRLLGDWCAANGVLHLLTGHQLEDQAETLLLRLAAGSGPDGLAAMPPIQETAWGRVLRPLLGVERSRLRATLAAGGQGWIEDPANADPAFARARLRRSARALAREGMTAGRLAATAGRLAEAREVLEGETAILLARAVSVFPAGHAQLDRAALAGAPVDLSRRALERVLLCVGGRRHAPRRARLAPLLDALRRAGALAPRTLGGCILRQAGDAVLVAREAAAIRETALAVPGAETLWDGRFRVAFAPGDAGRGRLRLGALGAAGWRDVGRAIERPPALPEGVCRALPALRDETGVLEVPHLGYRRAGAEWAPPVVARVAFAPNRPLAATEFAVV